MESHLKNCDPLCLQLHYKSRHHCQFPMNILTLIRLDFLRVVFSGDHSIVKQPIYSMLKVKKADTISHMLKPLVYL